MEIKYLKLIKTIAEEGNISGSANRLFLTQSALSHQLREIEESLGFKVFLRSRNNWKLTEEGEELYILAKKVFSEIEEGMEKIQHIREGSKGLIRISTECYSFYHGLPGFIQKMALLYPGIDIRLIIEATHHPVSKLLTNDLDISIVTSKPHHEELTVVKLFEDEVFAILHREHPLSEKNILEAADFSCLHLIIHSFPLETVSVYQHFLKPNKAEPLKITAIPLTEVALEMIQANMGVMCLPKWALNSFKMPDTLVFRKLGQKGFKRTHYLVFRKEDRRKKYIRDFIQNVADELYIR